MCSTQNGDCLSFGAELRETVLPIISIGNAYNTTAKQSICNQAIEVIENKVTFFNGTKDCRKKLLLKNGIVISSYFGKDFIGFIQGEGLIFTGSGAKPIFTMEGKDISMGGPILRILIDKDYVYWQTDTSHLKTFSPRCYSINK